MRERPKLRAAVPAAVITLLLLGATLVVVFWASDNASADTTAVYAGAEDGRLLLAFERVELADGGSRTWDALEPLPGDRDTRDGPVRIAAGGLAGDGFSMARVAFAGVKAENGGALDSLHLPQRVVELHVAGSGGQGDGLLIVFDAQASVQEEDGVLVFRPKIVHAGWVDGAAEGSAGVQVPDQWVPPLFSSAREGASGDPSGGADPTGGDGSGSGGDGGSGGDDDGGGGGAPPADVGWLTVGLIGNATGLMESLDVEVAALALALEDDPDSPMTRWVGQERVDLVGTGRADEPGAVATFQVDAGEYSQLAFEFSGAELWIHEDLDPEPAHVPQPFLGIEAGFSVPEGEHVTATVRIGVEESLRVGGSGYEFRPVVTGFAVEDGLGDELVSRGPSQYRSGGSWLPVLGEQPEARGAGEVPDPYQVPHPVWGDKERPPWAEGSLQHVDPAHVEAFVEHFLVELGVRGTQQQLLEALNGVEPEESLKVAVDDLLSGADPDDMVEDDPDLPLSPL